MDETEHRNGTQPQLTVPSIRRKRTPVIDYWLGFLYHNFLFSSILFVCTVFAGIHQVTASMIYPYNGVIWSLWQVKPNLKVIFFNVNCLLLCINGNKVLKKKMFGACKHTEAKPSEQKSTARQLLDPVWNDHGLQYVCQFKINITY